MIGAAAEGEAIGLRRMTRGGLLSLLTDSEGLGADQVIGTSLLIILGSPRPRGVPALGADPLLKKYNT